MIEVRDLSTMPGPEGALEVTFFGRKGERITVSLPRPRRGLLADALTLGLPQEGDAKPIMKRPAPGRHRAETPAEKTAWTLWSHEPTLALHVVATTVGVRPETLRWAFIRYHEEDYRELRAAHGRKCGRSMRARKGAKEVLPL